MLKNNSLKKSSEHDRDAFYGLVDRFQSITGGKKKDQPMRESKFTGLLKNVTDNNYLKDVIQTGQIGGVNHILIELNHCMGIIYLVLTKLLNSVFYTRLRYLLFIYH